MSEIEIFNPYIITEIKHRVALSPIYLNNSIYDNIFTESRKIENKYYKDQGFIIEVLDIIDCDNGMLVNEDNDSNVFYNVKLKCKVCRPMKNVIIYASIESIGQMLVLLSNGPIKICIPSENIDSTINKDELYIGKYVKVLLTNLICSHNNDNIIALGTIKDINVNDDEIKNHMEYLESY